MHHLYFDAGKYKNKIVCGYSIYLKDEEIFAGTTEIKTKLGSNCGECLSLIQVMAKAVELGIKEATVFGDSLLIINQATGKFKIKNKDLKSLHHQVDELKKRFDTIKFVWIPREENRRAHRLTK